MLSAHIHVVEEWIVDNALWESEILGIVDGGIVLVSFTKASP